MSRDAPRTRFAPSPTGLLHLGNARTALVNALLAGREGGAFILRLEDTDPERCRPGYAEAMLADLAWLGLRWDEGPDVGGPLGPYRQSERGAIYEEYFQRLQAAGLVYPCFCTAQELEAERAAARAAGRPPRYGGRCRRLDPAAAAERAAAGEPHTLRFAVPAGRTVRFDDLVRGAQSFASDDLGDFVVRRADGSPAFLFSNAVDDALMGVTHVLRGEDHLANTPRQLLLLEALELPAPAYGHVSLVTGTDGAPLSKRNGSRSLRELREAGFLPLAVVNYLARLGHTFEQDPGLADLAGLVAGFTLARLGRAPARFDPDQLLYWQKAALASLDDAALWRWLAASAAGPELERLVPAGTGPALVAAVRELVALPEDALAWARRLFGGQSDAGAREVMAGTGADFYREALALAEQGSGGFTGFARELGERTGRRGKALYLPLRAALTGAVAGPELARIWDLLGPERVAARLRQAAGVSGA